MMLCALLQALGSRMAGRRQLDAETCDAVPRYCTKKHNLGNWSKVFTGVFHAFFTTVMYHLSQGGTMT